MKLLFAVICIALVLAAQTPVINGPQTLQGGDPVQLLNYGSLRLVTTLPPAAPTLAVNVAVGVLNGAYYYGVTFVTATGESALGTIAGPVSPANQQVDLTNIPVATVGSVTARRIYRTTAGGLNAQMQLAATLANNSATTLTDNLADGSLGVFAPVTSSIGNSFLAGPTLLGSFSEENAGGPLNAATSLGYGALATRTGSGCTAIGSRALNLNTSGVYNTAIGRNAQALGTTGGWNTTVGVNSGGLNVTGNYNTCVGEGACRQQVNGSQNAILGMEAGYGTTASYSNNTLLGYFAGRQISTGSNNVIIGSNTAQTLTTGHDNILIGYNLDVGSANEISLLRIGGILSGDLTTGNTSVTGTMTGTGGLVAGASQGIWNAGGQITRYRNVVTVEHGVPASSWNATATAQAANLSAQAFSPAITSATAGRYRASCYIAVTRQATTTATVPDCNLICTDPTDSVAKTIQIVPAIAGVAANPTTSVASSGSGICDAAAATGITWSTTNYASTGATTMQYKVYIILEAM